MKKNITIIALLILILMLVCVDIFYFKKHSKVKVAMPYTMPTLNSPLQYFSDNDVAGGSGVTDNKNGWEYAVIDGGYQSFPTSTITLSSDDYSSEIIPLPPIQALKITPDNQPVQWLFNDQIKEYGDLARHFLPDDVITYVQKFDVDGDGKAEIIISICSTGGNHCPDEILIVKNNKIVFSISAGSVGLDLTQSETDNGFYVHWVPAPDQSKSSIWNTGLCCPPGYMKTRFVYDKGAFKPEYEQEVLYFKVTNTEYNGPIQ